MSPFFGKIQPRLRRIRGANPTPAAAGTLERASAPPAPRNPYGPRGGGGSNRQGARGAAGRIHPPARSRFLGSPHPEAARKTQRMGADPSLAPTRDPPRSPPVSGDRVTPEPVLPISRRKPCAASRRSVTSNRGTGSVGTGPAVRGWTATPSARGAPRLSANFRREAPSPWARTDARTPAALGAQSPPPDCHQVRDSRQRLPPAGAGSGVERGPQPLGAPPSARGSPSPPARTRRPPRSATGRGRRPERGSSRRKTGLGALQVTLAHPFPEETPAGRGPQRGRGERRAPLKPRRAAPPVWALRGPRPAGEGVAPAPRDALSPARPRRARLGATRRFSPLQPPTNRGGSAKGPPAPRRPCPRWCR